jgi:hypothetical protein
MEVTDSDVQVLGARQICKTRLGMIRCFLTEEHGQYIYEQWEGGKKICRKHFGRDKDEALKDFDAEVQALFQEIK